MFTIKQIFSVFIMLNLGLLVLFFTVSMRNPATEMNAEARKSNNPFLVDVSDDSDELYDMQRYQDVVERHKEVSKDANKDADSILPRDETEDIVPSLDVEDPRPAKTPVKPKTPEKPKTEEEKKKEMLIELNKKINSDPHLMELAQNFKKLKGYYQQLDGRYKTLQKKHNQMKTKQETEAKQTNLTKEGAALSKAAATTAMKKINDMNARAKQVQMVLRYSNPLYLLGGYPNITLEYFNSYPDGRPFYERPNYGLYNDADYCELTDFYNLAHPENMFKRKTFFTDYAKNGLPRKSVIRKIGYDLSPRISKYMPKRIFKSRTLRLDPRITNFFTKRVDLHIYHEIGKNFLCATQMYNHIPGHGVLKRKDMIVDSVDAYALRYKNNSQCFNKHKFFPFSYRLYIKEECKAFFKEINSKAYQTKLLTEPIQYVIKIGFGSHRAQGVFLFDKEQTLSLKKEYANGDLCGAHNRSLIAQTYVTNPLLLDFNNKFDFRVYMLVASTNPLIAYYHDGFLRVSLHPYDKYSNDRSTHLTNTHLSKDIFAEVTKMNKTLNGMTEAELRDYQMWTLEDLQEHLLKIGKINDPKWLDNYLRPKFKEAFIHIVRMTAGAFWKQSNVYEMFGLDFMLDSDLNLWFIECNSSPQLVGTNQYKTFFLIKMLKDLFDIQYSYYRSRMKRVVNLIKEMEAESAKQGMIDYVKWKKSYVEAWKNKLEPEFAINANNSFEIIIDQSKKGPSAYFGYLKNECVDD